MFSQSQKIYDLVYEAYGKDYQAEANVVVKLLESRGISATALGRTPSLLDVACGTGYHLEFLDAFDRTGVDLDPGMLALARDRCPDVTFVESDMRELDCDALGGPFDVVCCLFSSIAYMPDEAALREAIGSMNACLRPDGVLLIEPFLEPQVVEDGRISSIHVDKPDIKIVRMNVTRVKGTQMILDFHYLVAQAQGVEHFREPHLLSLFTNAEIGEVIREEGLEWEFDEDGLWGRGMHIGRR